MLSIHWMLILDGIHFMCLLYTATHSKTNHAQNRLVYYSDYNGTLCAPDFDFSMEFSLDLDLDFSNVTFEGNYAAWPDVRMYDIRICVEHCNDTVDDDRMVTPAFDANITDIGLDPDTGLTFDISGYRSVNIFDAICIPDPSYSGFLSDVLGADFDGFEDDLDSAADKVALAVNDTRTAWMLFLIWYVYSQTSVYILAQISYNPHSAGSAFIISMCWGFLIRLIGNIIIWLSILMTLGGTGLLAYYLIEFSESAYLYGYTTIGDIMWYSGVILGILDGMFALAVCFMWNRIQLAIALSKETTRALTTNWALFFYPLLPFFVFFIYLVYWVIGGLYMSSVIVKKEWPFPLGYLEPYYDNGPTLQSKLGLPMEDATYIYLEVDEQWEYLGLAHFFMLLWMTNFVSYHTYMVVAGVYAEWYFADWKDKKETVKWRGSDEDVLVIGDEVVRKEKDLDKIKERRSQLHAKGMDQNAPNNEVKEEMKKITKLSRFPVCSSFKRVTWYHLGTIAFGSLLIAIIEFIEHTLTYFEKKFINSEPSPVQKLVLAIIKCCLKCIKCILNRINRNGLIITSIYGWPFCAASMKGIVIILKNVVRASALSMVSGYLEKLGKICILSLNTGLCVAFAMYYYEDRLSSVMMPGILCAIITYVICWQYMHLYEVGISTIFICFLIDEERNKDLGEMKASKRLRTIIGAQKPPKKYLIDQSKSARGDGLFDPDAQKYFLQQDDMLPADERDEHMASVMSGSKRNVLVAPSPDIDPSSPGSYAFSVTQQDTDRDTDRELVVNMNPKKKQFAGKWAKSKYTNGGNGGTKVKIETEMAKHITNSKHKPEEPESPLL